jgi:hypothetical protein
LIVQSVDRTTTRCRSTMDLWRRWRHGSSKTGMRATRWSGPCRGVLGSTKRVGGSSLCVSLRGETMSVGRRWKRMTTVGGASAREETKLRYCWVVGRVVEVNMTFLLQRSMGGGSVAEVAWMKYCQKMKRRWRSHLGFMERKHGTTHRAWQHRPEERQHLGGKGGRQCQLGWREPNWADSTAKHEWWRFKATMHQTVNTFSPQHKNHICEINHMF